MTVKMPFSTVGGYCPLRRSFLNWISQKGYNTTQVKLMIAKTQTNKQTKLKTTIKYLFTRYLHYINFHPHIEKKNRGGTGGGGHFFDGSRVKKTDSDLFS